MAPDEVPEVVGATLSDEQVQSLLRDWEACVRVRRVLSRRSGPSQQDHGDAGVGLIRELIADETVRAVQVRYLHDGDAWCDTLMRGPDGIRLVRLRLPHEAPPGRRPT